MQGGWRWVGYFANPILQIAKPRDTAKGMITQTTADERLSLLSYSDLAEHQSEDTKTSVEKDPDKSIFQELFTQQGALVSRGLIPDHLIDAYKEYRETGLPKDRNAKDNYWGGWSYPTPFMNHEPLRDLALCSELSTHLSHLIGETMGLNLALTGWVSTQRNWHQDGYLNPRQLGSRYLAVWIALEDIDPDSGPFQYVPGSHRWPTITQEKLFAHLTPEERTSPHWPTFTQDQLARMCEEEIKERNASVVSHVPKRGDVLCWHSHLMHRGSKPNNPDLLRKSLILHFSSIRVRTKIDMPNVKSHKGTGVYFDLPTDGAVKP